VKVLRLLPALFILLGCSGGSKDSAVPDRGFTAPKQEKASGDKPKAESDAPKEVDKFGDEVFKVPPYPGAEKVAYTSLEMNSDASHSYNRHYSSKDSVDKVAEYYMTEGAKIGKLADTAITNKPGAPMRVVLVEVGEKEKLQVQIMNLPKDNSTDISVHYITNKK
jgi:hypothetical protein